jgi:enoyl-CoA hydratase/carnithine racemase
MGLVNRVVPEAELETFVKDYAETIGGNAPLTIKAVKIITTEILKEETKRDLSRCTAAVQECFDSQDYIEGRDAFMQKRKPVFRGV